MSRSSQGQRITREDTLTTFKVAMMMELSALRQEMQQLMMEKNFVRQRPQWKNCGRRTEEATRLGAKSRVPNPIVLSQPVQAVGASSTVPTTFMGQVPFNPLHVYQGWTPKAGYFGYRCYPPYPPGPNLQQTVPSGFYKPMQPTVRQTSQMSSPAISRRKSCCPCTDLPSKHKLQDIYEDCALYRGKRFERPPTQLQG